MMCSENLSVELKRKENLGVRERERERMLTYKYFDVEEWEKLKQKQKRFQYKTARRRMCRGKKEKGRWVDSLEPIVGQIVTARLFYNEMTLSFSTTKFLVTPPLLRDFYKMTKISSKALDLCTP